MEDKYIAYWLCTRPGIGVKRAERLLEHFGALSEIYRADARRLSRVRGLSPACIRTLLDSRGREEARREWEALGERGIRYVSCFDREYPERLRWIYQPPKHLYIRGELPDMSRPVIGIVGARDCTAYGRDMARLFGRHLAEAGLEVISGMARGIDGWAHQGALEGGGKTYAVLGCGVDVCYPAEHRRLYDCIKKRGGILSELPVEMRARPSFFPMRNRIISGLSDGILLVEARERSGSLITADAALEQGKDVFVVPGRIGDVLSVGCNRLIRQGAVPVTSPQDILEYYGVTPADRAEKTGGEETAEERILACMGAVPVHLDRVAAELKISRTEAMKGILKLKKEDRIRETARGYFVLS